MKAHRVKTLDRFENACVILEHCRTSNQNDNKLRNQENMKKEKVETDGGGVVPVASLLRPFDRLQGAMTRLSIKCNVHC